MPSLWDSVLFAECAAGEKPEPTGVWAGEGPCGNYYGWWMSECEGFGGGGGETTKCFVHFSVEKGVFLGVVWDSVLLAECADGEKSEPSGPCVGEGPCGNYYG